MKIRLLPGQVVIREERREPSERLWTPTPGARETRTHTGRVLALGPPARLNGSGVEVPHGFVVGDLVQYHFTSHQDAATRTWPPDGKPATWVQQENVDGVWEGNHIMQGFVRDWAVEHGMPIPIVESER